MDGDRWRELGGIVSDELGDSDSSTAVIKICIEFGNVALRWEGAQRLIELLLEGR